MKIYTITHKHLSLFESPSALRQPLYVGAYRCPPNERKADWEYDDTCNDDISRLNSTFCELTGLRYIWATATDRIIGLEHYRRYLHKEGVDTPLTARDIKSDLKKYDCIVARPAGCISNFDAKNCTLLQQYGFNHSENDLLLAQCVINEICSTEYQVAMSKALESHSFYPCNILICKKRLFKSYCTWLFEVMDELRKRLDIYHGRNLYQARVFGFIAERLLGVWIEANNLTACDYPMFDPKHPEDYYNIPFDPARDRLIVPPIKSERPLYQKTDFSRVFDAQYYLKNNNDLLETVGVDASALFNHFLDHGLEEGRLAHPRFSVQSYRNYHYQLRERYADNLVMYCMDYLKKDCSDGALGYQNTPLGYYESPFDYVYDYAYYSEEYEKELPDDVRNNTKMAFEHFMSVGMKKGYQANALFCPKEHLSPEEQNKLSMGEAINWENVFTRYLDSFSS